MAEHAKCGTCGETFARFKLRPYGAGGSLICHPCGMKPENRAAVDAAMAAIFSAPGHTIVTPNGLVKSAARDPEELIRQVIDLNNGERRQ